MTFAGLVDDAFHQIRQYSRTDVAVTIRLLEAIAVIAEHAYNNDNCVVLLRHTEMIKRGIPPSLDIEDRNATIGQPLSCTKSYNMEWFTMKR